MISIFLFSQNLILNSLEMFQEIMKKSEKTVILTSHKLFYYEQKYISSIAGDCEFITFADCLTDAELEKCDHDAYSTKQKDVFEYWEDVKEEKNKQIFKSIAKQYGNVEGYILSDDLGIDESVWIRKGFRRIYGDYYFMYAGVTKSENIRKKLKRIKTFRRFIKKIKTIRENRSSYDICPEVYSSLYNGKKIIFIGKMPRIAYRIGLDFIEDDEEAIRVSKGQYYKKEQAQYISTLHESGKCKVPDNDEYCVHYIQDGYLPSNYSNYYLKFKPQNVSYYSWDLLGSMLFKNHQLPVEIMPFRRKLYLPYAKFSKEIKKILIATSGSGDWTALKNRSDDDLMIEAFLDVAKEFPQIEFVYRCHPTWVHPEHVGVNSIKRVAELIEKSGLTNIKVSSNIPKEDMQNFTLSFSRSSLEDDMRDCDLVFGEHSVSMIDAAFQSVPFASVNVTKRRDLFKSITDMGFPHCESIDEIKSIILKFGDEDFQKAFNIAVDNYNKMTDIEVV